ncbi:MAG: CCA-adding enzyme [Promethearchaeota archaeon]|nr:MAG: CCA-adding enzyme [Candidatus Lokiarchaeota archaeon]
MTPIEDIFDEILEQIRPTKEEIDLIDKIVQKLSSLIRQKAEELNIDYRDIEPQGSTGIKQTQLRDDFDIDLFIGLDYTAFEKQYDNLDTRNLKKKIKEKFLWYCNNWIIESLAPSEFKNPTLLYAEHPYVQVKYKKKDITIQVDIVLYFDLEREYIRENGPITAVDRSPWHGKFVQKELSTAQKDDVRLLKQFFKACHSYGDKSALGRVGFIGYSAELLIYHFGDLIRVFENFNALEMTPLDYYGRTKEELNEIDHFHNDFLIIIDPIDKFRNVASAISQKAYRYCNSQVLKFLKNPSKKFFRIEEIPLFKPADTPRLTERLFIVESKDIKSDIHYTETRDKLYSLGDFLVTHGEKEYTHEKRFGKIFFEVFFKVPKREYNIALYCQNPQINPTYERRGPPSKAEKHVRKFKMKNPNYFEKNGYLWTETKRDYHRFDKFLSDTIQKRIPENLDIVNISNSKYAKTKSGRKTLYILKNMVLPFCSEY